MAITRQWLAGRVRQAIADAGMTQQAIAHAVGLDVTALSKALNGKRDLKSVELALIAEHLGLTPTDLLSEQSPSPRLAARVQPEADSATGRALDRSTILVELDRLIRDSGVPATPSRLPDVDPATLCSPVNDGAQLASQVRDVLGLGDAPLPSELSELATLLEQELGIDVAIEALPQGMDGLAVLSGGLRLALIASGGPVTRQRYTLAHELGHLVVGDHQNTIVDQNVTTGRTPDERRANAFAAAFLMPKTALRSAAGDRDVTEDLLAELLGRYRVSQQALVYRLHNVGIIDAARRDGLLAMSSTRLLLRAGRAADLQSWNERRPPGNLLGRALEAYATGRIGARPLAELLETDPERLLDELAPAHIDDAAAAEQEQ